MSFQHLLISCLLAIPTLAAPQLLDSRLGSAPQISLDYGTFKGTKAFRGVDSYLGIPFAKAGRFENPTVLSAADKLPGVQDATRYGKSCPQQQLIASPIGAENAQIGSILSAVEQIAFLPVANQGEDCLSVNVQAPAGLNSTAGLPVIFWIHGGGWELGSSGALGSETTVAQGVIYQGAHLVQQSMKLGRPIVFVSANHRLNAFGALASQEITDAGVSNLHLKDQRAAMRWIQDYIPAFGGDKSKVTLFGESAGSISIATQMVLNDGDTEGLFRGAIMASGGISKWKDYHHGQPTFDFIAKQTGCGAAANKLDCLKTVDYEKLYNAVQQVPNFFSYTSTSVPWYPRPDGTYLTDSPHRLLREGKVADIPYIIGDLKDEGTLFSVVPQLNLTTDEDFQQFWKEVFFQNLTPTQISDFTSLYSEDPTQGSPFDTGLANQLGPQYKRLSAAVGDYTFHTGRRDLLNHTPRQRSHTYLIEQSLPLIGAIPLVAPLAGLPVLGSFHASDVILNSFGLIPPSVSNLSRNIMSTIIAFVHSLDPNDHGLEDLPQWPVWDAQGKGMYRFREQGCDVVKDDFREKEIGFVNDNAEVYLY